MKKVIGTALVALALVGSASSAFAHTGYQGPNEQSELSKELRFWSQFTESGND